MKYVIYDTETTGLSPEFDQILQFAAILASDGLEVLDRFAIRCRLLPHIVPSPTALVVNGITPKILNDRTLPSHYEAVRQIRKKLTEWSPAIFLGYNSIDFDEKLLRQAFYQTLHPIFLTNSNANGRGDIMRMVYAASVYAGKGIKIPTGSEGRPLYKLDQVASANGYRPTRQHEAVADAEATLFMARHIRSNLPQIWENMLRWTSKDSVARFLNVEEQVSFTEFFFGKPYTWLVTYCGQNPERDSRLAVFDLQFAPQNYINLSVPQLIDAMNGSRKVVRELRANAQPILMPADATPGSVAAKNVGDAELMRRVGTIRNNQEFQKNIGAALAGRRPQGPPSPHVEERMYEAFPTPADEIVMRKLHSSDWEDRVGLHTKFQDPRMQELAQRLAYLERPDILPAKNRQQMDAWLAERILTSDANVPWRTVPKALQEADDQLANARREQAVLLRDVKRFLQELADRYAV